MKVMIDDILKKQNRTRYWLAKETEITYPTIKKLCDNKTESITFYNLEKICKSLNCYPSDIFDITNLTNV